MTVVRHALAAAVCALALTGSVHAGCGPSPDPCVVDGGQYHASLPDAVDGPIPAIVFLHGAGSSDRAMIDKMELARTATARGYAFLAPDGMSRQGRNGGFWNFHPDRRPLRDERAFLRAVVSDAANRFGVDPDRVILSGFSIGGSMVSYLACAHPDDYAAYAPVAGSFWRPHPKTCAGPVRLLHTHGWRDGTVPLEGREIRQLSGLTQGDVFHALSIWRAANGCTALRADRFSVSDNAWRRAWDRCTPGSALEFVLTPGGHGVPRGWASLMLDWFEGLPDQDGALR